MTRTVRLINLTAAPITVSAARADCDCAEFPNLPLTLAPGKPGEVEFVLKTPRRAAHAFRRQVAFETSVGLVPLAVRGTVRGSPAGEEAVGSNTSPGGTR